MTAPPPRIPALRVKLPCDDEQDFYARYADAVAEKGLKVPTANLRPVGSRVRLVLEFRNGQTLSGEAVVDVHVEGPRPAMVVRILKFERSRPAVTPAPAPTAARAAAPALAPAAPHAPEPATPAPGPAEAAPETSFESLFAEERETEAAPRPPDEATRQLEQLYDDASAAPGPRPDAAPEPTPEPRTVASAGASLPAASRRTVIVAVVAAGALVVGVLAYSFARRPAAPAATATGPAPSPAAAEAPLADRIASADRRLSEGRLTGPDGALDQLLAAKALAPDDVRVKGRLALLADTLENLGARALDRGDVAEAEAHLAAALLAAPDRQSISAKLEALAKVPQDRQPRTRGEKAPSPSETR